MNPLSLLRLAVLCSIAWNLSGAPLSLHDQWPQFRGPDGAGVAAPDARPPIHFGPATNVLWKTAVPSGHSSPVIWGDQVFLTGHASNTLETLCLNRRTGRIEWRRPAPLTTKIEATHRIATPASSTPVTDGTHLFVYFGSFGLLAYGLDGTPRWSLPLPSPVVEFGTGTSPILAGALVILICDQDDGSYLLAVDKATGRQAWRAERPEFRRSFASPFLWRHEGGEDLIVPGSIWLRAYDPRTGAERWSFSGTSRVANSSPCAGDGLLFSASWNVGADPADRVTMEPFETFAAANDRNHDGRFDRQEIPAGPVRERFSQMDVNKDGFVLREEWEMMRMMFAKAGNALLAIRPGGHGDITTSHLAWKSTRSLPYVASPVYFQGRLYTVKNGGLASCYEARTGRVLYQDERLDASGDYYASLIAAGGRIYGASEQGTVSVWTAGDRLAILARNDLGEKVMATPAAVGTTLFIRTTTQLYAFDGQ